MLPGNSPIVQGWAQLGGGRTVATPLLFHIAPELVSSNTQQHAFKKHNKQKVQFCIPLFINKLRMPCPVGKQEWVWSAEREVQGWEGVGADSRSSHDSAPEQTLGCKVVL